MKTESGFRYILFDDHEGNEAKVGDYVTVSLIYRNESDSVLYDSWKNGQPLRFQLERIPFHGSFEEGLLNMSENDSAAFFVPADSLYAYLYKERNAEEIAQAHTGFKPGTFYRFDIRLLKLQTNAEAEEEILLQSSASEKKEKKDLQEYLRNKNITVLPDSSGYYLIMRESGKGPSVDSGKIVEVEYEGRFLDGSIFDGTQGSGKPYRFISGAKHVIGGWELALKKLRQGDRVTLILPSKLAYGEEGIRDPQTGDYLVPPYTPLVFDIDILKVSDLPSISAY